MKQEKIRKAETKDLSRIAEILVFAKRATYGPIFHNDAFSFGALQVMKVAAEYNRESLLDHIFVFDDDEIIKGMIHVEKDRIAELYVDTFFENQGVGSALIEFAKKNFNAASLLVLEKNSNAIRFYERHGFHLTIKREPVEGTPEFCVLMER